MPTTDNNSNDDAEFTVCVIASAPPPSIEMNKNAARPKKQQPQPPPRQRFHLRLKPSSSLEQLRTDVFALFDVPMESTHSYQLSFLCGFPPKELLSTEGKQTVHEMGIQPNELLTAKFVLSDTYCSSSKNGENKEQTGDSENKTSSSNNNNTTAVHSPTQRTSSSTDAGRKKRASALAATANFRDVIAAQDAILNHESSLRKKNESFGSTGKRNNDIVKKSSTTINKRPKVVKMDGPGYRLSDGKNVVGNKSSSSSPGKRTIVTAGRKRHEEKLFNSEDDVAHKLLHSFGGGNTGGNNVSHYLRAAMRNAVAKSYEASRASVRVAAANTGEYRFIQVESGLDKEGQDETTLTKTLCTVSYSKGMEGRGFYEDQVEIIGLAVLKSVLESVYNIESHHGVDDDKVVGVCDGSADGRLRPVLIAQLSPRAFWSLVYHSCEASKNDQSSILPSVEDMLRWVLPQLDWSHLDRGGRMRLLSEKARENLKQQTGEISSIVHETLSSDHTEEETAKAIDELAEFTYNKAIAEDTDYTRSSKREMRVKAAMARFQNVNHEVSPMLPLPQHTASCYKPDDWTLITPSEDDIDELIECIRETSEDITTPSLAIAQTWAGILVNTVRNWRELANSSPECIHSLFIDVRHPQPSQDIIEEWIVAARVRSIEEIMLDILDGDQDAMEALSEKARSSTPRDLLFWKYAPGMLLNTISCTTNDASIQWSKSDIVRWIARAKIATDVCPWLELYTTKSIT